jgi:hypothetical protein
MSYRLGVAAFALTGALALFPGAVGGLLPGPIAAAPGEGEVVVPAETWKSRLQGLSRGMSVAQVEEKLKVRPRRVARQFFNHRYLEQWFFDTPFPTRLDFDCRQGEVAYLAAVPPESK